jgi:hypothetical protein
MIGREGLAAEETLRIGSYNALLKSSLPKEFQYYKADEETFESSHDAFRSALPRGFAWEVLSVYSGPPVISFKFRHWGFFEGPFKGHAPTEEKVEFYGFGILKVCFKRYWGKKNNTKLVIVKEKKKFLTWHAKNIKISFSFKKKKNISGNKYINFQV